MADVKISQLPAATTPVDGTEVLPIVQSATTKQVSIANLTAGRAMSASSLTLSTPLAVTSGGTGLATTAAGTLLSSTALNTISATATPTLGVAGTTAGSLGLSGSSSGVVTIATQNAAGTWTLKLPTTAGSNGWILTTDGSGNSNWTNPTALGVDLDVGGTAVTGGTDKYILYNNNGTLGNYAVTGTGTTAVMSTSPALSGNVTLDSATFSPSSPGTNGNMAMTGTLAMGSSFLRNRIINGDMRIDQRNAGASVSSGVSTVTYTVDRWYVAAVGAAVTAQRVSGPTGFQNALRVTGASSNTLVQIVQRIEANNSADMAGGTATFSCNLKASTATTVTVYFSYATATDNFTSTTAISNASFNVTSTATNFSTQVSIPAGATTGLQILIGCNSGLGSGVTLDITGVQLEVGSVATPFERRQYGQELALCQRYLPAFPYASGANPYIAAGMVTSLSSSTTAWFTVALPVTTRVPPTGVTVSAASHFAAFLPSTATTNATGLTFGGATTTSANFNISGLSGTTAGYSTLLYMNTSSAYMYFTGCEL